MVWESIFEKYRKEVIQSRLFMIEGKLQIKGEVLHVVAKCCINLTNLLRGLTTTNKDNLPIINAGTG